MDGHIRRPHTLRINNEESSNSEMSFLNGPTQQPFDFLEGISKPFKESITSKTENQASKSLGNVQVESHLQPDSMDTLNEAYEIPDVESPSSTKGLDLPIAQSSKPKSSFNEAIMSDPVISRLQNATAESSDEEVTFKKKSNGPRKPKKQLTPAK